MKKLISTALLVLIFGAAFSQVKYDNGPIILNNNFVTAGTWGRTNITFRFNNGTTDIAANDEQTAIRQAFQLWADYVPFTFTEVTGNADISVSWAVGNHGDGAANAFDGASPAGPILAHAFFPDANNATGLAGDVHFDDGETWTLAERANGGQPIDLVTVAAHEIGHALGLDHSTVNCALMNAFYTGSHRYLAQDDIDGMRSIYGNRPAIITNSTAPLCNSATYYFRNVPTGANVTWVSSDPATATINNQGVVTRANNSNGTVTITGTINLPCGNHVIESRDIQIGSPNNLTGTFSTATSTKPLQTVNNVPVGNIYAQYTWPGVSNPVAALAPGSPSGTGFYAYPNMFSFNIASNQNISVNLTGNGTCGQVTATRTFLQSSYGSFTIAATPNPAKGSIHITVIEPALINNKAGTTNISLYDLKTNVLIRQWAYQEMKSSSYKLNISGIREGYYMVRMERNNKIAMTRILIQ